MQGLDGKVAIVAGGGQDIGRPFGKLAPTALALAERSFNAQRENIRGIGRMAVNAVKPFYDLADSKEGGNAVNEKRKSNFQAFVK